MISASLKRHKALQSFSREHHHGLLLSWKIRCGFNKNVEVERIKTYADWFFVNHLLPHFELEETYVFPLLEEKNALVKRALADHRRLKRLFNEQNDIHKVLSKIEEVLEQHIRFEERCLFTEIQKVASETQLAELEVLHHHNGFKDKLDDEFWK